MLAEMLRLMIDGFDEETAALTRHLGIIILPGVPTVASDSSTLAKCHVLAPKWSLEAASGTRVSSAAHPALCHMTKLCATTVPP
jgi:hypothetical protein